MGDVLTLEEIKARYQSEWVLIGDPEEDESLDVLGGRVLFHSADPTETYRKAAELRPGRFATVYTGEIPEDMDYAL
jgi:hypothetical protein